MDEEEDALAIVDRIQIALNSACNNNRPDVAAVLEEALALASLSEAAESVEGGTSTET